MSTKKKSKSKNPKGDIDLFTPQVVSSKWHSNFQRVRSSTTAAEKRVLSGWAKGMRDRDGKFVKEFQQSFNSSFWELYLFALLRDAKCVFDQSQPRPDFVVTDGPLGAFVAEAVVASNAANTLPEWAKPFLDDPERSDLIDLACLRLAQAIHSKHKMWRESYSKLPHCVGQPYVICVAPFEQHGGFLQGTEAIDRVLFAGPGPVFRYENGVAQLLGFSQTPVVFKENGARVELGLFKDGMQEVSAVLFSALATWCKVHALANPSVEEVMFSAVRASEGLSTRLCGGRDGYSETLADGAHLFLNPNAAVPINPDPWFEMGCCIHRYSATGTWSQLHPDTLIHRRAIRAARGASRKLRPKHPKVPLGGRNYKRARPPDGEFFGGPGQLAAVDRVELTLYEGWTLLIGRDMKEDKWGCMAKPAVHLSIQDFVDGASGFNTSLVVGRDDALQEARDRIDMWGEGAAGW